jgi:hypothetical protein
MRSNSASDPRHIERPDGSLSYGSVITLDDYPDFLRAGAAFLSKCGQGAATTLELSSETLP